MRSFWITQLSPMTCVLMRERRGEYRRMKRRPWEDGDRDGSYAKTSMEHVESPETVRGKERFSPRAFIGSTALTTV